MKNILYVMSLFFVSMLMVSSNLYAQSGSMLPEKIDQYSVWLGLVVIVWEYLIANNKNVKSNSTIDLLISGAKKFFGLDRYTKTK